MALLVGRREFWGVFLAILFVAPITRSLGNKIPEKLPILGSVPQFDLRDQSDRSFGSANLRGRVWIADFIFTRCPTICPVVTAKMGEIQHRGRNLGEALHLVSFSVDPDHDSPLVLAQYARAHRVSPRMWSLLTGAYEGVKKVVADGFRMSMGREGKDVGDPGAVFHGTHFVLVDSSMRIRGYYDLSTAAMTDKLLRDAGLLVNEVQQ